MPFPISDDWHGKPLNLDGVRVALLPDAHLGRKFVNDVPLHRRGERERMIEDDFCRHLAMAEDADLHVCVGDLFDKAVVSLDTIMFAAKAYMNAVDAFPETQFIVYPGNHDLSRNLEAVSAYDIFRQIIETAERSNITVLRDHPMTEVVKGRAFGFVPWHPVKSSAEMAQDMLNYSARHLTAIFGHWDIINPGSDHNIVPVETVRGRTDLIITGHDHRRRLMNYGGDLQVLVTGSMQPYAHGEDVTGEMYRTVSLAELARIEDTRNLCLRVVLADGEEMPEVDALQVKPMRQKALEEELSVSFETFDMASIFADVFASKGISPEITKLVMDRYRTERV
jgi:DNA repair exonuclease SbcCD nuclease subunit